MCTAAKRNRNPIWEIYALYVSFFPQLVAGPIERSTRLLPQFFKTVEFDYGRVTSGLRRMAWGLFKKVVIADRIAVVVDLIYGHPQGYTGLPLIIATILFALQIYCDFSGYSDIAIGCSRTLGYDLMENFQRPYFAKSISEFWKRWHISLTTWFRDYLYIPMGGNRVPKHLYYRNIFLVFLISGLWHGASWKFVVWGALHGVFMLFSIWTRDFRRWFVHWSGLLKIPLFHNFLSMIFTFALVCFAWIFFRANSFDDAFYIVTHIYPPAEINIYEVFHAGYLKSLIGQLGVSQNEIIIIVFSIATLEGVQFIQETSNRIQSFRIFPTGVRWAIYYALTSAIIFLGAFNSSQEFIYFQF